MIVAALQPDCFHPQRATTSSSPAQLLSYYHASRTHLALDKDSPDRRAVEPLDRGLVVALPQVGGLHHATVRAVWHQEQSSSFVEKSERDPTSPHEPGSRHLPSCGERSSPPDARLQSEKAIIRPTPMMPLCRGVARSSFGQRQGKIRPERSTNITWSEHLPHA